MTSMWRIGWIAILSFLILIPATFAQGEEFADRQSPSFRLNLLRSGNFAPNGQTPPYFWSGVYLRNAFDPNGDLGSFRLDSSLCGVGIAGGQQFGSEFKAYYSYNMEGQISEVVFKQERPGPIYENFSRKVFSYTNGQITSYLFQKWNVASSSWQDDYEELTAYDSDGIQMSFTIREVDMSGQWTNLMKEERVLDQDGNIGEVRTAKWENNAWLDTARKEISYNDLGFFTQIYEQSWNGNAWDTLSRESAIYGSQGFSWDGYLYEEKTSNGSERVLREQYSYDNRGYWSEMLLQSWDSQANSWKDESRESYDYTRKGIWISWNRQDWVNNAWVDSYRQGFENDGGNRLDVRQSWDANSSAWVKELRTLARYDANFNLIEEAGEQIWNGSAWENSTNSKRCQHFWSEETATSIRPKLPQFSCNMSNPYRAYSPISCDALEAGKNYAVKLSDMQGRMLVDKNIPGGSNFSINKKLPAGIYTLNIYENQEIRYARKVLIRE